MLNNRYVKIDDVQNEVRKICEEYNIAYGEQYGGFAKKIAKLTDSLQEATVDIKIGKWHINENGFAVCSCCNGSYDQKLHGIYLYKYCPHCEAKMEALE